jgi:hypothetical protein
MDPYCNAEARTARSCARSLPNSPYSKRITGNPEVIARSVTETRLCVFMKHQGWYCQFLEADLKTSLPRKLSLEGPEKLIEMAEPGGGLSNREADQMLRYGIEMGRGGVWLSLTKEQYQKLKTKDK